MRVRNVSHMKMDRPHDLGGQEGYGAIEIDTDAEPFRHEWEARVFAINRLLLARGLYTLDAFRYEIERLDADRYREMSYYERWLFAIERLCESRSEDHA